MTRSTGRGLVLPQPTFASDNHKKTMVCGHRDLVNETCAGHLDKLFLFFGPPRLNVGTQGWLPDALSRVVSLTGVGGGLQTHCQSAS